MAEVFVSFGERVNAPDGVRYIARACGGEMDDGRWQGWIEFEAVDGSAVLRSPRETTQPNRTDTEYWATGLTPIYLEGALERAQRQGGPVRVPEPDLPAFDGPLPAAHDAGARTAAVLNPFSVYRKGEVHLRRQLGALDAWHLVNIIGAYDLSERSGEALSLVAPSELTELIVQGVKETVEARP
jgi:hypothetical protein